MLKLKVLLLLAFLSTSAGAASVFVVDDFNGGKPMNKMGNGTGCWNVNPSDTNQYCKVSFDSFNFVGQEGYALKIDYDVDTPQTYVKEFPNTAMSGYFSPIKGANLRKMKFLVLSLKGDPEKGFTRAVTIELKNNKESGAFLLEGITDKWQEFSIPLWKFKLGDMSDMREFLINFNERITRKSGTLYVDNVYFTSGVDEDEISAVKLRAGEKIEVDGDLHEWEKNRRIKFIKYDNAEHIEAGYIKDKIDCEVMAAFFWDDQYLYFGAWVRDDKVICPFKGPDLYKGDGIELYLDPQNDNLKWGDSTDFQVGFAPISPDSDEPQVWSWFQNQDPGESVDLASRVLKLRKWEGYQVEAAINWKYLNLVPKTGMSIGCSPAFNDFDGTPALSGKLNWSFTKAAEETFKLGNMKLVE